jgi:hypothetical protein
MEEKLLIVKISSTKHLDKQQLLNLFDQGIHTWNGDNIEIIAELPKIV